MTLELFSVSDRVGCVLLLHTQPTHAHMDPPGGLVYIPLGLTCSGTTC